MIILPQEFQAGLTFDVPAVLTAHQAPEWDVSALLKGPSGIRIDATHEGVNHRFRVEASDTAQWEPGRYWYSVRAQSELDVIEIESSQIVIKPDFSGIATGYDGRTHAEKTLEAIEAVIEHRATQDQQRYTINNRELWRTPISDLLKLRDRYRLEVRRAKAKRTGLFSGKVEYRFDKA